MKAHTLIRQMAWFSILTTAIDSTAQADWLREQAELVALSDTCIAAEVGRDKAGRF